MKYKKGTRPTAIRPKSKKKHRERRYLLERMKGRAMNPFVVLGMNPSHANLKVADKTVARVASVAAEKGHDGWIMLNLYPVRGSDPRRLDAYDRRLARKNARAIVKRLKKYGVREVVGAWGDLKVPALRRAKNLVLAELRAAGIEIYYYGALTKAGNPRHPNPRKGRWDVDGKRNLLAF
jgi:hypothetical protein